MHRRKHLGKPVSGLRPPRSRVLGFVILAGLLPISRPAHADTLSPGAFTGEVATWRQLAARCAGSAAACDGSRVPDRQEVQGAGQPSFTVRWAWLQDALQSAGKASASDRTRAMQEVAAHLTALETEAGPQNSPPVMPAFHEARLAANAALARPEFRTVEQGPGWFDRKLARVQGALLHLFSGVVRLGEQAPWLAPTIEWGCFALIAAALLWAVRRNLQRQALRIALYDGQSLHSSAHGGSAADWAEAAERYAKAQQWRDAVHSLYWAAIASLESRRAWKPNATRTPREYLRLLRPETEAQTALRSLTDAFERVWYGNTPAGQAQYLTALASYRVLGSAKAERRGAPVTAAAPPAAAGGA